MRDDSIAFGAPGMSSRWTSGAKDSVGTPYHSCSSVWSLPARASSDISIFHPLTLPTPLPSSFSSRTVKLSVTRSGVIWSRSRITRSKMCCFAGFRTPHAIEFLREYADCVAAETARVSTALIQCISGTLLGNPTTTSRCGLWSTRIAGSYLVEDCASPAPPPRFAGAPTNGPR